MKTAPIYHTAELGLYTDGALYFHCAKDVGHKLDNIARNHNACFSIVDSVELMQGVPTKYRSVTVFGTVDVVKDAAEKRSAIEALALKISPDYREAGLEYSIQRSTRSVC